MSSRTDQPDVVDEILGINARLSNLESAQKRVLALASAPTHTAPDGTLYLDTSAERLYVRVGGAWKYAALT